MVIIMQNSDVFEKDRKYIAHTYHRFPAAIKNGHGAQAEDLEKDIEAGEIAEKCVENGLLILTAKEKLRIMPPLNISLEEIDKGLNILKECLSGALS